MKRYYIVEGDKTTAGGIVQKHTGSGSTTSWHGKTVSNIDDKIDCPACNSVGKIQPVGDRQSFGNRGFIPALNDDLCICKCSPPPKLIHSQTVFYQNISDNVSTASSISSEHGASSQNNFKNNLVDDKKQELLNGYYYNIETGLFEGKISTGKGNQEDVYACNGKKSDIEFISPQKANITHKKFQECCKVVSHESGTATIECIYIAFTANNYAKETKTDLHSLLMSEYSTMPKETKTPLPDTIVSGDIEQKNRLSRKGVLKVYMGHEDPTNGATHWDGTDFLAWGLKSPYKYKDGTNKPHAKFREYNKISIPKTIYDEYLSGTLKEYPKARVKYSGITYDIPAEVFKNLKNWVNNNFEYNTGSKQTKSLVAKVTAGHTIFWKAS